MTISRDELDKRLSDALNRQGSANPNDAHPISPTERDALHHLIAVTEEKIENQIAGKKVRKFRGILSAIARERNKRKPKGK